jgi:hypothetical protein
MPGKSKVLMNSCKLLLLIVTLAAASLFCIGCGGGGGGSSSSALGLEVAPPTLTGKTGQQISVPIEVTGTGTIHTATFDIHFNSGVFDPALSENSAAIETAAANSVCRYKWIDVQTVRVMYASSTGTAGGNVLVSVPLNVVSEEQSSLTLRNVSLNE